MPTDEYFAGRQLMTTHFRKKLRLLLVFLVHRSISLMIMMLPVAEGASPASSSSGSAWSPCENVCGGIPVMYPFGASRGCGSKAFEKYVNCSSSKGRLLLYTPTGQYAVQKIDYANNVMVVSDPAMSTCAKLGAGTGFGLPVGSPFQVVAGDRFLLLGCAESALANSAATLCDAAATPICAALYSSCPTIAAAGLGSSASCCVYAGASAAQQQQQQPFQIDLPLLQCAAYSSVYAFGTSSTAAVHDPSTWSYGIALKFFYDQSLFDATCQSCQRSRGSCAYNVYGFVCVCSAGVNTTTDCFGTAHFSSAPQMPAISTDMITIFMQGMLPLFLRLIFKFLGSEY